MLQRKLRTSVSDPDTAIFTAPGNPRRACGTEVDDHNR